MIKFNYENAIKHLNEQGYSPHNNDDFKCIVIGQELYITVKIENNWLSRNYLKDIETAIAIGVPADYRKEIEYITSELDNEKKQYLKIEFHYQPCSFYSRYD